VKEARFVDGSLDALKKFPEIARRAAGYEIDQVQRGGLPRDWKPMPAVGKGVREIRIHSGGEYRIFYVAAFADAIYVLHAFSKKSQKTPHQEIDLAAERFRALVQSRERLGFK